jgi:patatin-like phospholipase/acyl hydrolase
MSMRILSVDGGGYLGLAVAAFIDGVERHFGVSLHSRFDLFCGTSTGAIVSLGLATGKTGADIVDIYRRHGVRIFPPSSAWRNWLRRQKSLLRPMYPTDPLRDALHDAFADLTLGDVRARGKSALVTAFCTTTGQPRIFKTDYTEQPTPFAHYRLRDIALASSAAPTYFPLVEIANPVDQRPEVFCDGGLVANHPALVGYAEALAALRMPARQIRLLSLATPQSDLGEHGRAIPGLERGLWGWRHNLGSIVIDANATIAHQVLRRIVDSYAAPGPLYERVQMANPDGTPFDRADSHTTKMLMELGAATAALPAVRQRLAPFFQ